MTRILVALVVACTPTTPHTGPTTNPPPSPGLLGRAAPALVCPAGTFASVVPPDPSCSGRIFDVPAPRFCAPREHSLCSTRFGTSEGGSATICRSTNGAHQERFQIRERDGSVIAEGTCKAGGVDGALYRWRDGSLSEVIPMRDGVANGLYIRWERGRIVDTGEFVHGARAATPPAAVSPPRSTRLIGRAAPALTCPSGTTPYQVPPQPPCVGRVFDFPAPRACMARENWLCGARFGTSEDGFATACRTADGTFEGPFQVREHDGSVVAEGACRAGALDGTSYRWLDGELSEVTPLRDGTVSGVWTRWKSGRVDYSAEFVEDIKVGEP